MSISERNTSRPSEASRALENLADKIQLLPNNDVRMGLEEDFCYLSRKIEYLTEAAAIAAYRELHSRVRFAVAKADIDELKARLCSQGGLFQWTRSLWGDRLDKWLMGHDISNFNTDTINAFFDEAAAIAEELDCQIEKASQPTRRYPTSPEKTGKTARERPKTARTARNKAADRAEENRRHLKGPSGGGGHQSHPSNKGEGKRKK